MKGTGGHGTGRMREHRAPGSVSPRWDGQPEAISRPGPMRSLSGLFLQFESSDRILLRREITQVRGGLGLGSGLLGCRFGFHGMSGFEGPTLLCSRQACGLRPHSSWSGDRAGPRRTWPWRRASWQQVWLSWDFRWCGLTCRSARSASCRPWHSFLRGGRGGQPLTSSWQRASWSRVWLSCGFSF